MVIVRREGSRVDGTFCPESLLMFKGCGVKELEREGGGERRESVKGDFLGEAGQVELCQTPCPGSPWLCCPWMQ